jgi:hypothetical protein
MGRTAVRSGKNKLGICEQESSANILMTWIFKASVFIADYMVSHLEDKSS